MPVYWTDSDPDSGTVKRLNGSGKTTEGKPSTIHLGGEKENMNVQKIKDEILRRINDQQDPRCLNVLNGLLCWINATEGSMDDLMDDAAILHDYSQIRQNIVEGINRHVLLHEPKGNFITAVLTNNLSEAFACADNENCKTMFQIASYCHNQIPGVCWGSPEKVKRWIEQGPNSTPHFLSPENPKELDRQTAAGIWCATHHKQETQGGPGVPTGGGS